MGVLQLLIAKCSRPNINLCFCRFSSGLEGWPGKTVFGPTPRRGLFADQVRVSVALRTRMACMRVTGLDVIFALACSARVAGLKCVLALACLARVTGVEAILALACSARGIELKFILALACLARVTGLK